MNEAASDNGAPAASASPSSDPAAGRGMAARDAACEPAAERAAWQAERAAATERGAANERDPEPAERAGGAEELARWPASNADARPSATDMRPTVPEIHASSPAERLRSLACGACGPCGCGACSRSLHSKRGKKHR
ncbi:MAG: hypothetical protein R3B70_20405 [Polyangiaceae bacterium]